VQQLDVPIIQKTYELYKTMHGYQKSIPKLERFTIWQKCENAALSVLEGLIQAGYLSPDRRVDLLTRVSAHVDMLRVFLRLAHDTKTIDQKKYIALQAITDEIGRMLGGLLKSLRAK
jgi:four helix bundle protein